MTVIRPYEAKDFPAIQAVHDPARRQELASAGLEAAFLPLSLAAGREGLFDYTLAVAECSGQVVGFVAYTGGELAWLYVRPDWQRRGVGTALAKYALDRMAPGPKTVEVLAGNEPARRLYRRLGFVQEELLHGQMPGNEGFSVAVYAMTMA